jgi:hypothetical protein
MGRYRKDAIREARSAFKFEPASVGLLEALECGSADNLSDASADDVPASWSCDA